MRPIFLFVAFAIAAPVNAADNKAVSASPLSALTYSGDQTALESLDRDLVAAGKDATKLAALEKQLLDALKRKDATFAGRQAICQRLGLVLAQSSAKTDPAPYKGLAALLTDERDYDLARLALEPAPGEAIDALFLAALKKSSGRARLGLIDSLGRRRAASAVDSLAALLKNSDRPTAAAAARALGNIANSAAVAALQEVGRSLPSADAIIKAELAAATRLPARDAIELLREIERDAPENAQRLAAFRLTLDVEPATATAKIADTLSGKDWLRKQVALESVFASHAPDLVSMLTSKLASWDAPTQAAVIAALGRRADASALSAIVGAASHSDAEVRRAALEAIGNFPGNRETTELLAKRAADSESDDAKLARQTLARLNGPDVNATILAGAEQGDAKLRTVYLEQIGLRNMTEGTPLLLRAHGDSDPAIRMAAVGALGEIAQPAEQRTLIEWASGATDDAESSRALRSLVNLIQRDTSKDRGREFYDAIEKAPTDVGVRLMPALQRIGGAASADCAARLASRNDQKIADAAVTALTRWNDRVALTALATVAERAALPAARADALKGALTTLEKNRDAWTADSTKVLSGLLAGATESDTRKRLVALLNRGNEKSALALAQKLRADPEVGAAAGEAAEVIRANMAGAPVLRASENESAVKNMIDGKSSTRWNVETNGAEWIEIEFKASRPVHRITLDQTGRATEFPEHYEVFITDDAKNPGAPRASGTGQRNKTVIDLPAGTRGRTIVIKNTKPRAESQWSICELFVD